MQEIVTLGVNGGFNTDVDKPFYDGSTYLMAENFTATTKGGSTIGSLENSKGNNLISELDFGSGYIVVGYANVVRDIAFFVTDGSNSKIMRYSSDGTLTEVYSDELLSEKLGFSLLKENRIVAVGKQELLDINKVYWIDGLHELRFIDLDKDYKPDGTYLPVNSLNHIPQVTFDGLGGETHRFQVLTAAGNLPTGKAYYTYQLYNNNGVASVFHPIFGGVNISQYAGSKDGGSDLGETSGCAVKGRIFVRNDAINSQFNRIRIVSVFYESESDPIINIVKEIPLTENYVEFIDIGDSLGELTVEELNTFNQTSYIPQAIASKDNHLFLGNLEETTFTSPVLDDPSHPDYWDARAYRYRSAGNAYLYESYTSDRYGHFIKVDSNALIQEVNNVPDVSINDKVPADYNCYCYTNSIYGSSNLTERLGDIYQANGIIVGGEGERLSYSVVDSNNVIGKILPMREKVLSNNQRDSLDESGVPETQDFEVYRIGIRFFNDKGQRSFVKWIGDVYTGESDNRFYAHNAEDIVSSSKQIQVTLKSYPNDPSIKSYQIVRARRENSDITVVASGKTESAIYDSIDDIYRPYIFGASTAGTITGNMFNFKLISPDLMFNSNPNLDLSSYKIALLNKYTDLDKEESTLSGSSDFVLRYHKMSSMSESPRGIYNIKDFAYPIPSNVSSSFNTVTIDGISYRNQIRHPISTLNKFAPGCSTYVVKPDGIANSAVDINTSYHFKLIKNTDQSRYGGIDYNSILNTEYIPYSDVVVLPVTARCVNGDTYSSFYYYMAANLQDEIGDPGQLTSVNAFSAFPVQSRVDCRRRLDRILDFRNSLDTTQDGDLHNLMWIQETIDEGLKWYPQTYDVKIGDLYRYNTIHSTDNIADASFSKPFDFIDNPHSTTKVIASQKKVNGEGQDSWLQFLPNDFIEVDSAFGGVTNLMTMDNGLFFWQDKAFGKLAVNERSLIEDGSGAKLALGTGGVLERFDYYSTEIGNIEKYNISKSENAMTWLYTPKRSIYRFDGKLQELSTTKGVSKLLYHNTPAYPITISDHENQESLITIDGRVLVYDWFLDKFTGVYTYEPEWFVPEFNGNFLSSPDGISFYRHNSDTQTRANYYGVDNKSTIKHILSTEFGTSKVFDVLNWHSTSLNDEVNNYEDTFDTYRFYNDYQNTDWQTISWKRNERSYTSIIPRDRVNKPQSDNADIMLASNLDGTQQFKRRMRDKYLIIDLEYTNKADTTFSFPYINVGIRRSIR